MKPPATTSEALAAGLHLASPAACAELLSGGRWRRAPHLDLLSQWLVDVAVGRRQRIIVTVPPRHGKSHLVSLWGCVWRLGLEPHRRIILASYEADFARHWGRAVRNQVAASFPDLGVKIADDSSAGHRWETAEGGGMVTTGVGGPMTGRGADLLVVDDPVKNAEEAASAVVREAVWDWWTSTARTRLEPRGGIALVQTRWHEDDLAGRLLRASADGSGEHWDHLNLPALAEDADALGRPAGAALWPERYDEDALATIRQGVGSRVWAALYQQRPAPAEGAAIKRTWWRYYDLPPETMAESMEQLILSWDLAFKDLSTSDYVVAQAWGRKGASYYLLAQLRARMDAPETMAAFRAMWRKWPQAVAKLVEDTANGPALIATLRHEVPGIVAIPAKGSKDSRLSAIAPLIEAGNVYLPRLAPGRNEPATWAAALVEEAAAFPAGAHDDTVDAMSQALNWLVRGGRSEVGRAWDEAKEGPPPRDLAEVRAREWAEMREARLKELRGEDTAPMSDRYAAMAGGWED